jgi:hypothetical protein
LHRASPYSGCLLRPAIVALNTDIRIWITDADTDTGVGSKLCLTICVTTRFADLHVSGIIYCGLLFIVIYCGNNMFFGCVLRKIRKTHPPNTRAPSVYKGYAMPILCIHVHSVISSPQSKWLGCAQLTWSIPFRAAEADT